jgi:hypothetical protein
MTTQHHLTITKIMVSAAIVLGSIVVGAAPAGADPNAIGNQPSPFNGLSCGSCRETAPPGSPLQREEIERGLRKGFAIGLPAHDDRAT